MLVGLFHCQGELAAPAKQMMLGSNMPELRQWAEEDRSQGYPREEQLAQAQAFARAMLEAES